MYLQSLIENKNEELIDKVLEEAKRIKHDKGYLQGATDGRPEPVYQTKWLIFGLKSLGMDYSEYDIPNDLIDEYFSLTWFDKNVEENEEYTEGISELSNYPYLDYAVYNYYDIEDVPVKTEYPISYETNPSKANFSNMAILNKSYKDLKMVVPHSWAAAEMFMYLIERK